MIYRARPTTYVRDGEGRERLALVLPPLRPSRRASCPFSRYDRLDPAASPRPAHPEPEVEPGSPMDSVAGMERLRAALDRLQAKMEAAKPSLDEITRATAALRAAGRRGL